MFTQVIFNYVETGLQKLLDRFAELERRVRKLKVEDQGLREEIKALRNRLDSVETERDELIAELQSERGLRSRAVGRIDELIERLSRMREGGKSAEAQAGE